MEQGFQIYSTLIDRVGQVKKSTYNLTILRETFFSVAVEKLPLTEYFVFFDHPSKSEQIKAKLYKTISDNKWYDKHYSEEAELNSPEFGIPELNSEIKKAIDVFESLPVVV
jgi:hypothetical protein